MPCDHLHSVPPALDRAGSVVAVSELLIARVRAMEGHPVLGPVLGVERIEIDLAELAVLRPDERAAPEEAQIAPLALPAHLL